MYLISFQSKLACCVISLALLKFLIYTKIIKYWLCKGFVNLSTTMFNTFLVDKQLFAGKCAPLVKQPRMGIRAVKHCWSSLINCTANKVSSYPITPNFPILEHSLNKRIERRRRIKRSHFVAFIVAIIIQYQKH